jgi:hypothetical protein
MPHQPCLKNIDLFCRDVLPHAEVGEIPQWGLNHPSDADALPYDLPTLRLIYRLWCSYCRKANARQ